jgi:hypothetical protein
MTVQISQRGQQCLKTAETLLRAAQTMADRAIAGQLKALADDYQQRAEKTSHVDAAKALARSAADAEDEWGARADRQPILRKKCGAMLGCLARGLVTSFLFLP